MDQSIGAREQPRYIRLNERDNVAIVVNDLGLPAGTRVRLRADAASLRAAGPQGGARPTSARAQAIRRYGEVIGTAADAHRRRRLDRRSHASDMPTPPPLDALPLATAPPTAAAPLDRLHLRGLSQCRRLGRHEEHSRHHHQRAVRRRHGRVRRQAHQGRAAAELPQCRRRGRADPHLWLRRRHQRAAAVVPIRTLQNIARNPNFGGEVMVVGLGCEKLSPSGCVPEGVGDSVVRLQDEALRRLRRHGRRPSWRWPRSG